MRLPVTAVALAIGAACTPSVVDADLQGVLVHVDAPQGTIGVQHEGRALLELSAGQIAFKDGDARFDMQFGMFLIEEDEDPFVPVAKLAVKRVEEGALIELALKDDADVEVGTATIRAASEGHVVLEMVPAAAGVDRVKVAARCADDDHFAGLGGQTHDVDHRGQVVPLWVSEQGVGKLDDDEYPELWQVVGRRHTTHIPIPAMVTSRASALLVDTPAFARFDICATKDDELSFEVWESRLALHVFAGADPLDALGKMSAHVGRPEMPPAWAFGPWNDAVGGRDAVREYAAFLRAADIPSSALWFEDWRGGSDSGALYRLDEDWRADPVMYPDLPALNDELQGEGFAPMVYFNTFVTEGADIDEEVHAQGLMIHRADGSPYIFDGVDADFSPTALVDLTNADALAFVDEHLQGALDDGAMGWMADFAEWMPVDDVKLASGEDPALVHNRYPVLWQEAQQRAIEQGAIVYVRSGHLGSQRLAPVVWAGDQRTSFQDDDGLPTIIPIGLGLSATAFFLYTHDVGGYQSSTNPPRTKEVFFRWTELGAYTPVMRTHHGTHVGTNWNLRSDEETTAHWKRYATLHARLYPYLRGLARRFLDEGRPLWIPPGLLHPDDDDQWALKDQLFLGDALLVAPVVVEGATSRSVRLPAGRFVPFAPDGAEVGDAVAGPTTVDVDAPLGEIPVFLAAGGIVPLLADPPATLFPAGSGTDGDRVVYVGLGASGRFVEDDGATYELEGDGTAGAMADLTGDDTFAGDGFTFTTTGHPSGRAIHVVFR